MTDRTSRPERSVFFTCPRVAARFAGPALVLALLASTVTAQSFRRGDVDGDGSMSVGDAVATLDFLFRGGRDVACPDAADTDDSGIIELTDAVRSLGFLFLGGAAPAVPGPSVCGSDPTIDGLAPCVYESCPTETSEPPDGFDPLDLHLPETKVSVVASVFERAQIERALALVLNSPGDTVRLEMRGSFSVALIPGIPFNASVLHRPTVTLVEGGVYEVQLLYQTAGGLGVELVEGIEASLARAQRASVVFRFEDLSGTARALQSIVFGEIMAPAAGIAGDLLGEIAGLVDEIAGLEARLPELLDDVRVKRAALNVAQTIENAARIQLNATRAALDAGLREINNLVGRLADALADFGCDVLGLCDEANRLRRAVDAARREVDGLRAEVARLERELSAAIDARRAAEAAFEGARRAEAVLRHQLSNFSAALQRARQALAEAERIARSLDDGARDLQVHMSAVEIEMALGSNVSLFLSPFPGVSLENAGVGASLSGDLHVAVRLNLDRDVNVSGLQLRAGNWTTIQVAAGLGAGVNGRVILKLDATVDFRRQGREFDFTESRMKLAVDAQAVAVAGVGVATQTGAGREIGIDLDILELGPVAEELWRIVSEGSIDGIARAIGGVEATFTLQDRRIAAAVARAGGSYLGYGAEIGGSATWEDRGQRLSATMTVAEGVRALFGIVELESLVESLASEIE